MSHTKLNLSDSLSDYQSLLVAVSGGPDSVALAHALKAAGFRITLAHLNHGVRGEESDADARFVDNLAKEWGVELVTEKLNIDSRLRGNEGRWREERYAFLERTRSQVGAEVIVTAHHQDDQVETVLMHMLRGAGARGLCGMQALNGKVVRPLLNTPKSEILSYLEVHQLSYRTDSTNLENHFERNRIRNKVIPALEQDWPTLKEDLLLLSKEAQDYYLKLSQSVQLWVQQHVREGAFLRSKFLELEEELQGEVVLELLGREGVYRKEVEAILKLIRGGKTGKQCSGFSLEYELVRLTGKKVRSLDLARDDEVCDVQAGNEGRWGRWSIQNRSKLDLTIRSWKKGDRFQPAGMKGTKKLQDFFVDQKIPKSERHQLPIILNSENQVVAVARLRVASGYEHLKESLYISQLQD